MYTVTYINTESHDCTRVGCLTPKLEVALKHVIDHLQDMDYDVEKAFNDLMNDGMHFYFDGIYIQYWEKQAN